MLGGFAVEGIDEKSLGTRKARLLLKRLAVASGRPVPTEELASALWPTGLPKQPADQVSVLVSRLRSVLGSDRLPRSDAGYCLAADWFDLAELDRAVGELEERLGSGEKASALAAAHAALGLATGGLLPEEDGDWVDEVRPAAERLVARARLLAAAAALAAGQSGAARAAAQSVLDFDPYDEEALRLVMRADAAAGRPGAALAAYAAVRHRLSEDLGADPAPETELLHTAIVRGELSTVPDVASGPTELRGRDAEIETLDELLEEAAGGASVAVVIQADAGMGKSALLSAWTTLAADRALVISGRCDELGGDLPLQPVVDGLARHLVGLGRAAAEELVGPERSVLDPLLGRTTPGLVSGTTVVADMEAARASLFAGLSAVLRRAAGDRPLVLVVDDLHQAAPGTAEFLSFCLRRLPALTVVAARRAQPGPDLPAARKLVLGPLSLADVAAIVGPARAAALHERSGGHPLFLRELADAEGEQLPGSIVAAVRARLGNLGPAAASIEVAASCGTEIDAALLSAISTRPVPVVLDDLEEAARAGLLSPRHAGLAFSHELVREAIEAGTSGPRRSEIHRRAVAELGRRRYTDPLALARHARLAGDPVVAAQALTEAAAQSKDRFELATAESLLDQALALWDTAAARLARGQARLARLDLNGAREDAQAAIDLGAGVAGFELAGWVAYYGRDYDTALRYADEGVERTGDAALRASCLALAGRIRHTRGLLAEAADRFEEGVSIAPAGVRAVVQVWHAQLLAHRGESDRAVDVARRGLLDPHLGHPFAWGHGRFTLAYALGLSGKWSAALREVDALDEMVSRQGDRRFPPVAANLRGWLLRGAGLVEPARELHRFAVEFDPGPTFQEARYAGLLDLAECALAAAEPDEAARATEAARGVLDWTGSMSWRHRNRYRLLACRVGSLGGGHAEAAAAARAVASAAAERGDRRYQQRGLLVAALIEARSGAPVDLEALGALADRYSSLGGPDGWRDLAELAVVTRSQEVWHLAEKLAGAVLTEASSRPDLDAHLVADSLREQLDRFRP